MRIKLDQETIVLALAIVLFAVFAVTINGFLTPGNLLTLLRNVAVLGTLGLGMAMVIIGRGIDLSMVANMAISTAWMVMLLNGGWSLAVAICGGLGLALALGLVNGFLVAYAEVPALFATLATATFVYGFGHASLIGSDEVYLPKTSPILTFLGGGRILGVPMSVVMFVCAAIFVALLLNKTKYGQFFYAIGDNYLASRISGMPARPLIVVEYLASSAVAFFAGLIVVTAVTSMDTRVASSTLIYDVILVAVLGGIGLSGGRGGVRNVIVGTLLIGVLFNGLTILDVPFTSQNVVKSVILLAAIIIDGVINPRDEQTAQQGDI